MQLLGVVGTQPQGARLSRGNMDQLTKAERLFMARSFRVQRVVTETGLTRLSLSLLQAVAVNEGHSLNFYAEQIGVTAATASRPMYDICDGARKEGEPLNFVEVRVRPEDRRMLAHYVTDKGRKFIRRLMSILHGAEDKKMMLQLLNGTAD